MGSLHLKANSLGWEKVLSFTALEPSQEEYSQGLWRQAPSPSLMSTVLGCDLQLTPFQGFFLYSRLDGFPTKWICFQVEWSHIIALKSFQIYCLEHVGDRKLLWLPFARVNIDLLIISCSADHGSLQAFFKSKLQSPHFNSAPWKLMYYAEMYKEEI